MHVTGQRILYTDFFYPDFIVLSFLFFFSVVHSLWYLQQDRASKPRIIYNVTIQEQLVMHLDFIALYVTIQEQLVIHLHFQSLYNIVLNIDTKMPVEFVKMLTILTLRSNLDLD